MEGWRQRVSPGACSKSLMSGNQGLGWVWAEFGIILQISLQFFSRKKNGAGLYHPQTSVNEYWLPLQGDMILDEEIVPKEDNHQLTSQDM